MKFNGHILAQDIPLRFITQVFFLSKKVIFSVSTFQALTKQATKGICIVCFVKGHKVD